MAEQIQLTPLSGALAGKLEEVTRETVRLQYLLSLPTGPLRDAVRWRDELDIAVHFLEQLLRDMEASRQN